MAQLVERIDAKLVAESDEFVRGELLAKKAAYLARTGHSEEAQSIIRQVRLTFSDGRSGRVTCLLQVAEGISLYHSMMQEAASDKFSRALFLAQALKQPDIIGICAVWKAFIDFDQSRFESMQRDLLLVRDLGLESDHAVQSRFAITNMIGFTLLGERQLSRKWFQVGHSHAVADGDLECIDALLFDRAVFGLARLRVGWCLGSFDQDWAHAVRSELKSSTNLQQLVGVKVLRNHIELCTARLDLMEGRYREAQELLERLTNLDGFGGKHVNSTALAIDRLFADFHSGHMDAALASASTIDLTNLAGLDPDERLVALTLLTRLAKEPSAQGRIVSPEQELEEAKLDYKAYEQKLRASLSPWTN